MSNSKPEFTTAHRLPKGSVWRVKAELVGGTRLEGLSDPADALPRVKISPEAFEALKGLRHRGETIREAVEWLIFAAAEQPSRVAR
ncbi:hypothetical protein AWB68_07788 [Caballeronia choica]|jgi:hypothetical protein|uniref:Uncharacterized protein n=1 Tax=Caballeronia choica TaxID=326476 RepID=A0A158KZB3_9BURK|nr:hypothetical protein [Caballeronia choica]SAL85741.1 hypothetical protein AWB68_07788 [Caballeronia choica]